MSVLIEAFTLVDDAAVPFEAEDLEITQNLVAGTGHDARCVHVFDTQKPAALARSGFAIAGQRRYQRAKVKGS